MKLLDLFCGAGGAAMGYHRAGFEVVGVDHRPQKNYPFEFIEMDAFEALERFGPYFDAVHASPPCQAYSYLNNKGTDHPLLIDPIREKLIDLTCPFIIENVMGARLDGNYLCGGMFGLPFYRHRVFETNFFWLSPGHPRHYLNSCDDPYSSTLSDSYNAALRRKDNGQVDTSMMGITWMTRKELVQAIPPVYTEYIGNVLREARFKAL